MIEILNGIRETIHYGDSSHFRLYRNIYNENYPPHWHVGIEIIVPLQNWYKVHIGKDHYTLEENDILFINSGVIHSLESPDKGERIILQFDLSLFYNLKEFDTTLFMLPSAVKITKKDFPQIYPTIHTCVFNIIQEYNIDAPLKEASIYGNLIQIYVALCRKIIYDQNFFKDTAHSKRHEYIEKLMKTCNYINQHYNEELSLDTIADIAGFSKYHFTRLFKEFTNMTFHQYLTKQRLQKSEILLMDTNLSVMEVALSSGFNSISTFNRSFKQSKGCSANEFRKKRVAHGLG
jgi:AraC-like DNA-binding protein